MSDVAHRARVNRVTLYQHFRTREELLGAVIERISEEVTTLLTTAAAPGQRVDFMLDYMLDHPEVGRLWIYGILAEIPIANPAGWARYQHSIEQFAASDAAAPGIDAEMLAHVLHGAVLLWSVRANSRIADPGERRAQTHRYAHELNRLLRHGALRPGASTDDTAQGTRKEE
jgi:AcrR family transcriptional regulator